MSFLKRLLGKKDSSPVSLEEQISILAESGILLNDGVSIEDFLISYDRESYEKTPYELALHMYGFEIEQEPWGRYLSDSAWNFDTECIEGSGSYAEVMSNIVRITQRSDILSDVSDDFDFEKPTATVRYILNSNKKERVVKIDSDWVDPNFVDYFLAEVSDTISDGRKFWSIDNGQALILFFLTDANANNLNKLSNGSLKRVI